MNVIGPQFGFHDHRQPGLDPVEEPGRRTGQVVRQVAVLDAWLIGEHRVNPLRTGRGHAGHGDRKLWVTLKQCTDHRCRGDALAHRHRMYPKATRLHHRQADGETLTDAFGVCRGLARTQPQPNRYQWQPEVKQRGIEGSVHGAGVYRLFQSIACKCTANRSASQRAAGPSVSSRRQTNSTTNAGGVHSLTSSTICP
ncbi:hypothetical protein D3C85_540160 [compost metagenome]